MTFTSRSPPALRMNYTDNQELLQLFIQQAPAAVAMFDREMRYLLFSHRWLTEQNLGEDIIGRSYYEIERGVADRWQTIHQRCLAGSIEKVEESLPRTDGTVEWVRWEVQPWRTGTGEIGGLIVSREAIAERHPSQEHLHLLEKAIAASNNGIVISDASLPDNPLIYINPSFKEMTGYSESEVLGHNCRFLQGIDTEQPAIAQLRTAIRDGKECNVTLRNYRKDGTLFWNELRVAPVKNPQGKLTNFVGVQTDITDRVEAQEHLIRISKAVENASDAIIITNAKGQSLYHNPAFVELFEYTTDEINAAGGPAIRYCDPNVAREVISTIKQGNSCWSGEVEMRTQSDRTISILLRADAIADDNGNVVGLIGIHTDITARKQAEAVLRQLLRREQLLGAMQERIRQSLKLEDVLNTAVAEVRQFLQTDRTILYRFEPDGSGTVVVESVSTQWLAVLGSNIKDPCFGKTYAAAYQQGRIRVIEDIYTAQLNPCHIELLEQFQVRANLVVPILQGDHLWGLLIAHHCRSSRQWQYEEVELLEALSVQIAIAIQQAALFEQVEAELARSQAAQTALRDSEERLRTVVKSAPIVLFALDDRGVITFSEGSGLDTLGLEAGKVVGQSIFEVYRRFPQILEEVRQALSGKALTSLVKMGKLTFEVRYSPLRNANNEVMGAIGVATDITERIQVEETLRQSEVLRQSEAKTRALLDAIPDSMFRIREDGTFLDFRAAKNDVRAIAPAQVIGQTVQELLPTEVAQQMLHYVAKALSANEIQVFEYQLLAPLNPAYPTGEIGSVRDYEARVVVNGADEVLAIVRDITERKEMERLKNEFVSIVSHELRTPLTSVRGSLSLIAGGVTGEIPNEAKALVNIAYKNTERLILLINDILDIEKIESGKMDFHLQPLELMPLVEQALEANRGYGEQFGVQLVLESELSGVQVNVDRDRLMQVLTNLLSNAAKFSPPNGTVTLSVSRPTQSPNTIRVAVTDCGCGIPEDFRPRIFQKFAQADSSDTRQKGGTGLGLSICKAIVEKLGGHISFETQTNVGTTFYFDLPEWQEARISKIMTSHSPESLPILICEDDPDIATLLSLMLKQEGLSADIAYNAAQAKQLLSENCYAAMTVDLALPGQDGISLIRELREDENTQSLPIVVVSAKAQQGREQLSGGGLPVIDWLDKPIDQARLMASVRQAVRQNSDSKPHILYVEDDPDLTQVVSTILQNIAEIDSAKNLHEARHKLSSKTFDLVILDLSLPDGSGLELLADLNNQIFSSIPAVIFSANTVGMEAAHHVAAALVKSRTSNQQLLETIKSLIGRGNSAS
ncbi:PAS domain S-box protein [Coleofasciculus sp. FACHB-542]|uniref:PAS domain S-box protein n=1 Tax=Coleofasciculus sp. FACHB-542 TaxID=2692787 RepID=UPI00168488F2|nr:PAS domain S-box protein [Coleofasciculus sp. FACHB-542]MBD2084137.1 PAS domain S-box protein [Coleofasciculus sp. FACHB-542]